MDTLVIFLVASGSLIALLAIIDVFLFFKLNQTHKKLDELLEKGKVKDFKDIFLKQKERNDELDGSLKEAFQKIKNLEDVSERTIQKTSVVRFNPFNNMGGNQSFTIALLDDKNNGFVISSLFVKEGNRVYAKSVKSGKSDHLLSNEEKEAINQAMGSK
ncbi:MAG: DUF4446 family protein [Candidatus Staskawiczbacteria bacterium]|nr:DUF4446 family protein [Candidatus Staskawiczbacteria bacterium]